MSGDRRDRFDEAFRAWARRPPRTPARRAAERVVARLDRGRARSALSLPPFRLSAAAAALALAIAAAWFVSRPGPVPNDSVARPPLEEHVVLLWLDPETPLYLTVAPPATGGDSP